MFLSRGAPIVGKVLVPHLYPEALVVDRGFGDAFGTVLGDT